VTPGRARACCSIVAVEPVWVEFHAAIGEDPTEFDPTPSVGCHRRRIPARVVFAAAGSVQRARRRAREAADTPGGRGVPKTVWRDGVDWRSWRSTRDRNWMWPGPWWCSQRVTEHALHQVRGVRGHRAAG
jgi:hypothetical protein